MVGRLLKLAAAVVALLVTAAVAGLLGALAGEWGVKSRRFEAGRAAIAPALAADPAGAGLEIAMSSGDGSAHLQGEVPATADLDRLRARLAWLLGTARAVDPLAGVAAAAASPDRAP